MAGACGNVGMSSVLLLKTEQQQQQVSSSGKGLRLSSGGNSSRVGNFQIRLRAGVGVPSKERLESIFHTELFGMMMTPLQTRSSPFGHFSQKVAVVFPYEESGRDWRSSRLAVSCSARGPADAAVQERKKVIVKVVDNNMVLRPSAESIMGSTEVRDSRDFVNLVELRRKSSTRTLYLVDVHPLCYEGKKPRPTAMLKWMKLLFDQVTHEDPVIAVMDGERGNDYRRSLLPSYKLNRNKYKPMSALRGPYFKGDEMDLREAFPRIQAFLAQCDVPVLKLEDAEADDVVATLMHQAVSNGMKVVIASPDMDFRQLLSENVNMLLPLPEFGRWSFYTLEQYMAQNTCDPSLDLGLRCIMGDSSDNVPGLPDLAPGFGRKTALKLMKKHGSLENLLVAAKSRTVGRPYIQEALTQHADVLHRNLQVLKLRRDVGVTLKEEWCSTRDRTNEVQAFQLLEKSLRRKTVLVKQSR